jgi:hypothetical protein
LTHHSGGDILSTKEERDLFWPSPDPNATLKTLPILNFEAIMLLKIMGLGIARPAPACISRIFKRMGREK